MGTEEEPYEGNIPMDKLEGAVMQMFEKDKRSGHKFKYAFDGYPHTNIEDFLNFVDKIGSPPDSIITCFIEN